MLYFRGTIEIALYKLEGKIHQKKEEIKKEYEILKKKVDKLVKARDKKIKWLSDNLPDKKITEKMIKEINKIDESIKDMQIRISQLEVIMRDKELMVLKQI